MTSALSSHFYVIQQIPKRSPQARGQRKAAKRGNEDVIKYTKKIYRDSSCGEKSQAIQNLFFVIVKWEK